MPSTAIPVVPETVVQHVVSRRRGSGRAEGRAELRRSLVASDSSDDDNEEEATFQLWQTKRDLTTSLMSSMQKDADTMLVLVFTADNTSYMRSDLSRFDLLLECRKSVPDSALPGGTALHLGHSRGAALQLRDIRALQDVQRPSLMVRMGAIIVSIEPLNAIITHDRAFVVVPDGADDLLEPLLHRVRNGHSDSDAQAHNTAFEFLALEALLMTLVSHHKQQVQRYVLFTRLRMMITAAAIFADTHQTHGCIIHASAVRVEKAKMRVPSLMINI